MIYPERLTPCDMVQVPVFFTRRTVEGIAAEKNMFDESVIVILRYVEDDGKDHDIIVSSPGCFHGEKNYYNTDEGTWIYG